MTTLISHDTSASPASPIAAAKPLKRFDRDEFLKLIGIAFAAYAVSFYFFAPRFALWNGLYIPAAHSTPEVNRAVDVLTQLADPFAKIDNPSNVVLQWRLFFPIIGHYLHLPVPLFFAIPHLGCLLTLLYIAHVARLFVVQWLKVFLITALMATTSWFFISNGWLSYQDSWYVLGLLLVSFSRSYPLLITACLVEPFIDERFVLTIPLALAVRMLTVPVTPATRRRFRNDAIIVIAMVVPYVALRLVLLHGDAGSTSYLKNRASELHDPIPWTQYLLGPWMGLRLLWIGVGAAIWRTFARKRYVAGAIISAATALTIAMALVIAADLSRSISATVPAALLGIFLLLRDFPAIMRWGLPAMLAGNLLMPAWNVVTLFNEPIYYLYASMNEYAHPPPPVNADYYLQNAQVLMGNQKNSDALILLNWSVRLNPSLVGAWESRAIVYSNMNNVTAAVSDADQALAMTPDAADALFTRGYIHLRQGHGEDAAVMLQRALKAGGPQWPQKAQCESLLNQINRPRPPVVPAAPTGQPAGQPAEAPWHLSL